MSRILNPQGEQQIEQGAKARLAIAATILTIVTSTVTYTITVSKLYFDLRQEIALIKQRQEYHEQSEGLQRGNLMQRIEQLEQRSR